VAWRGLHPSSKNSQSAHPAGVETGGLRGWLRANLVLAALLANFVVVGVAAIIAIGVLAAAWSLDSDGEERRVTTTVTDTDSR
jgi:hypothetical protein